MLDASALVEYLLRTDLGVAFSGLVAAEDVHRAVPALCDVEVLAACRRGILRGELTLDRAVEVVSDYLDMPIERHAHAALLPRLLELHANFSAYDAAYVALAEVLDAELVTADLALARSTVQHTGVRIAEPESQGS